VALAAAILNAHIGQKLIAKACTSAVAGAGPV